jgi:hypothetical protein
VRGGGHRQVAAGERLAQAHDVRRHLGVVGGEQLAGRPETGGDLVEDQQDTVLGTQPRGAGARYSGA